MNIDPIVAIATARGTAALAVVRVSGVGSIQVADRVFRGSVALSEAPSHTAHFGRIFDGTEEVDQVVATVFRGPNSPTGDDLVEISCHGGEVASRLVLDSLRSSGARMADAGEFTMRAFVAGKMDLLQAEAVADLIHAGSHAAHRAAVRQLEGRASDRLERIRDELLDAAGYVELEQDFSEEDVEFADRTRLDGLLKEAENELFRLLGTGRTAEVLRDGVRVVIAGRPNAGKSTLLNALVGYSRAIVNERAGTTRDLVEAETEIEGFRYRFVDTAGLRDASDVIEMEGVDRAHAAIGSADALLYIVDGTIGAVPAEVDYARRQSAECPVIFVVNKVDLVPGGMLVPSSDATSIEFGAPDGQVLSSVRLSAKEALQNEDALQPLLSELIGVLRPLLSSAEVAPLAGNARQRDHLSSALSAVRSARAGLTSGLSGDLLSLDLRAALTDIGSITGAITNEDVLGRIFSRFCIGK